MDAVKKFFAFLTAVLFLFAGCGREEEYPGIGISILTRYIDTVEEPFLQDVLDAHTDIECSVIPIATGHFENDPSAAMGGLVKLTSLIAANEVDVLVSSMAEAERQAAADTFAPLSDAFTVEELAGFEQVSFEVVDDQGIEGALHNIPCGILLTDSEISSLDESGMALFLISNTQNPDAAREIFLVIAEMYAK